MSIFEYDKEKEEKKLRKAERECGREEGLQEGLKEGLQQGRMEERKSLLALIAKMSAGGDADQIATLYDPEVMNAMQEKYGIRYQEIQMIIQIFGTKKCNDTKKAERFFKERGIKYQFIDMKEKGMSKGESFDKQVHCVNLTESTIEANKRFFASAEDVPKQAYTMGIKTIMQAKKILIVASGEDKAEIVQKAFFGPITPQVPASVLQLHNDVTLVADEAALSKLSE